MTYNTASTPPPASLTLRDVWTDVCRCLADAQRHLEEAAARQAEANVLQERANALQERANARMAYVLQKQEDFVLSVVEAQVRKIREEAAQLRRQAAQQAQVNRERWQVLRAAREQEQPRADQVSARVVRFLADGQSTPAMGAGFSKEGHHDHG
jgi:hypothetical protein